jgi:3-oxoacyl-[acyl-carrier-protein] synthase II
MSYPFRSHYQYCRLPAQRQVVVTGVGTVCAAGNNAKDFWRSLIEGRSGISRITRFDTTGMDSTIAGEVKGFDPLQLIAPRLKPKRLSRQTQFAVVAAQEAARDAGLDFSLRRSGKRIGVVVGSSICGLEAVTESAVKVQQKGAGFGNPSIIPIGNLQASALAITELLELEDAFAMGISTACISGTDAVKTASDMIRSGRFDAVICGGTDAPLSRTPMAEFTLAGLCSMRNDSPEKASRPFDRERDSGTIAEGCGIVVLESLESAADRGAAPYAEILGDYAAVDPDKTRPGGGLESTMRGALENARCSPGEIDFISAWGCGHPVIDRCETEAIKRVFGTHADEMAVGSIKGVTGIPLGASGVLQLVALALSYRHEMLPPTLNCDRPDLDCDLDYVSGSPRRMRLRKTLLNAHGLGGGNTCLVLDRASSSR